MASGSVLVRTPKDGTADAVRFLVKHINETVKRTIDDEPEPRTVCLLNQERDCDRTVIRQARNLEGRRGLPTHTEEYVWEVNSLITYALGCFDG